MQKIGKIEKSKKKGNKSLIIHHCQKPPNLLLIRWYTSSKLFFCLCLALRSFPIWSQLDVTAFPLLPAVALGTYTALHGAFSYVPFDDIFF